MQKTILSPEQRERARKYREMALNILAVKEIERVYREKEINNENKEPFNLSMTGMKTMYTIKLMNEKYYVGTTIDLKKRLCDHRLLFYNSR